MESVLGVAANMCEGRLWFGLNGDWSPPMGICFDNINIKTAIFPAFTAGNMALFVNWGEVSFKFGPPDAGFRKVIEMIR